MSKSNSTVDVEIRNISESLDELKDLVKEQRTELKRDVELLYERFDDKTTKIQEKMRKNEAKYYDSFSGKWVEKVVLGIITGFGVAILGVVIALA